MYLTNFLLFLNNSNIFNVIIYLEYAIAYAGRWDEH